MTILLAVRCAAEEDWGEGLKVLTTYMPKSCEYAAEDNDVIHYHYVGRLGDTGEVFGRRCMNSVVLFDKLLEN